MNDKQLDQLEKEILSGMKEEEAVEEMIEHASEEIASQLVKKMVHTSYINETPYFFEYISYKQQDTLMLCVKVSSVNARRIDLKNAPRTVLEVPYDSDYSELENVQGMIEAFIRHKTGHIKVEETE